MNKNRSQAIKAIEQNTQDLRKCQAKIGLLEDLAGLSKREQELAASLGSGVRWIRGCHLGELRVSAGMGIE